MELSLVDMTVGVGVSVIGFILLKLWTMDTELKEIKTDVKWLIEFHKDKDKDSNTKKGTLFG